jgi:hypothetical protein
MTRRAQSGMSLIEIMVSVTLLSLIVIGLVVVFNNTTRALRIAHNMTDVFEGARATDDMVVRDFAGLAANGNTNSYNIFAADLWPMIYTLPTGEIRTNVVQDIFLISRENDTWLATGYFIDQKASGIGTLYRYSVAAQWYDDNFSYSFFTNWFQSFKTTTIDQAHRVTDGIIHFKAHAYDQRGRIYQPDWTIAMFANTNLSAADKARLNDNIHISTNWFAFSGDYTPAYIEVEIGILEPETTRRFNALAANNSVAAQNFLLDNQAKVHLFRQRIPVRNHTSPPAFD